MENVKNKYDHKDKDSHGKQKNKATNEKKRKRTLKDENAPKLPISAYVRFLNERREQIRNDNAGLSYLEITKMLSAEWKEMEAQDKEVYSIEAEKEKEQYQKDLDAYHKTDVYKNFIKKQEQFKKAEKDGNNTNLKGAGNAKIMTQSDALNVDIPIFTEEFLDHNKGREAELRKLRKQNTEFEEQNALLGKHIDNMKDAISQLEVDVVQQRNNNTNLQRQLELLRQSLVNNFMSIPIPGTNEYPSLDSIDSYMPRLVSALTEGPYKNDSLLVKVRDIVQRIKFESSS